MKQYRLMKTDYVTSCIYQTNDVMKMKNKIINILANLYKVHYYALSGISKLNIEDLYYEGCWIDVYEDNKLIQSVMLEEGDLLI